MKKTNRAKRQGRSEKKQKNTKKHKKPQQKGGTKPPPRARRRGKRGGGGGNFFPPGKKTLGIWDLSKGVRKVWMFFMGCLWGGGSLLEDWRRKTGNPQNGGPRPAANGRHEGKRKKEKKGREEKKKEGTQPPGNGEEGNGKKGKKTVFGKALISNSGPRGRLFQRAGHTRRTGAEQDPKGADLLAGGTRGGGGGGGPGGGGGSGSD